MQAPHRRDHLATTALLLLALFVLEQVFVFCLSLARTVLAGVCTRLWPGSPACEVALEQVARPLLQPTGLALAVAAVTCATVWRSREADGGRGVRRVLALRPAAVWVLGVAALLGVWDRYVSGAVGLLAEVGGSPAEAEALRLEIARAGPWIEGPSAGDVVATALVVPVVEEAQHNGLMWYLLERHLPTVWVWLLTSSAYALAHVGEEGAWLVMPVLFLYGLLRWRTGSVWPGVVAHVAYNALAMAWLTWPVLFGASYVPVLVGSTVLLAAVGAWRVGVRFRR